MIAGASALINTPVVTSSFPSDFVSAIIAPLLAD